MVIYLWFIVDEETEEEDDEFPSINLKLEMKNGQICRKIQSKNKRYKKLEDNMAVIERDLRQQISSGMSSEYLSDSTSSCQIMYKNTVLTKEQMIRNSPFSVKHHRAKYSIEITSSVSLEELVRELSELKYIFSPQTLEDLEFNYEFDDNTTKLEFDCDKQFHWSKSGKSFSSVCLNVLLKSVNSLSFFCCPLQTFLNVQLPNCRHLRFEQHSDCEGRLSFTAPMLKSISFENIRYLSRTIEKDLTNSLLSSPHLETFSSYKLRGLSSPGPLYLPSLENMTLYLGERLRSLRLYAPRLKQLNLRAPYDISEVKLYGRGHKMHNKLIHRAVENQ